MTSESPKEISKSEFMRRTGLGRTAYADYLKRNVIPQPIKTSGRQFRHLESDIDIYLQNRRKLLIPKSDEHILLLREVKRVTF